MDSLLPFIILKVGLGGVLPIAFALREIWLLDHGKDDPEVTRKFLRFFGNREFVPMEPARPDAEPAPAPAQAPAEPLAKAA